MPALRSVIGGLLLGLPWAVAQAGANDQRQPLNASATPPHHSPWLFVPLVSSNPKLGTSLGAMVGYIHRFDAVSEPSLLATQVRRSNTDSRTFAIGGKAYWNENRDQLQLGIARGKVTNDYSDFLGTGREVRSEETLRGYFLRYQHKVRSDWYADAQALYSNYDVEGSDPSSAQFLDLAGLAGEVSAGAGLIVSYDSPDNSSNPTRGSLLQVHSFAFRDGGPGSGLPTSPRLLSLRRLNREGTKHSSHGQSVCRQRKTDAVPTGA